MMMTMTVVLQINPSAGLARLSCDPGAASDVRQSGGGKVVPYHFLAARTTGSPVVDLLNLPRAQFGSLCGFTCITSIFFSFSFFLLCFGSVSFGYIEIRKLQFVNKQPNPHFYRVRKP